MGSQASLNKPKSKEAGYVSEYNKQHYQANKIAMAIKHKLYYESNKESYLKRHQVYKRKKYVNNPEYKLRSLVSRAVAYGLKKNGQSVTKYLPYSFKELKLHLESQFEFWMSWDNHGIYDPKSWNDNDISTWTWQIDHIVPQSEFSYSSMTDDSFINCWALNNLRPLAAKQNHLDGVNRSRHRK